MGKFPVLRGLLKNTPRNLQDGSRPCKNCKEYFVTDSIRFKCFRHPPYSPDNGSNRYPSFCVRLVTFKLLIIWKQAISCDGNNEDRFKF